MHLQPDVVDALLAAPRDRVSPLSQKRRLDGRLAVSGSTPRETDCQALPVLRIQPNFSRELALLPRARLYMRDCHGNVPSLSRLAWMAAVPNIAI
jgi:hypothetical protein